jgi:hypothetical protein
MSIYLGLPILHDCHKYTADLEVYAESRLFKVEVPVIFFVEGGFSLRRD